MFENMTRDQAIDYMLDQFAIHCDGNDQQAHAIATERNAGFASPETVAQATGHLIKDNYLSEKYSFWNIPFGHYATVWAWATKWERPIQWSLDKLSNCMYSGNTLNVRLM